MLRLARRHDRNEFFDGGDRVMAGELANFGRTFRPAAGIAALARSELAHFLLSPLFSGRTYHGDPSPSIAGGLKPALAS